MYQNNEIVSCVIVTNPAGFFYSRTVDLIFNFCEQSLSLYCGIFRLFSIRVSSLCNSSESIKTLATLIFRAYHPFAWNWKSIQLTQLIINLLHGIKYFLFYLNMWKNIKRYFGLLNYTFLKLFYIVFFINKIGHQYL